MDLVLHRIDNELPDIHQDIKRILGEIYKSQIMFFNEMQQHDKCEQLNDLFDRLIKKLNDEFYTKKMHDFQIEIICDQIKNDLERWKTKWINPVLNIQQSNQAFSELIQHVEAGFRIMSTIFKYVSIKTATVSDKIVKVEAVNVQLQTQVQQIQGQMKDLQSNEAKRVKKEKKLEKQILVRDLFIIGRQRLLNEFDKLFDQLIGTAVFMIFIMALRNDFNHMISEVAKPFVFTLIIFAITSAFARNSDVAINPLCIEYNI
ncbi:unnamed protein product [Rotaria sp. Silwood2]|nr:unnamed protein product [Rotaria sp. Silwood2]CAF4555687.1 unnamed protein product [Rotaria sp. Silwood2]